uniref:Uncharacterized protein n=1 Tax=Glossina austeni TaxID=7395 RepID=A0A1A9VKP8_GLOAU
MIRRPTMGLKGPAHSNQTDVLDSLILREHQLPNRQKGEGEEMSGVPICLGSNGAAVKALPLKFISHRKLMEYNHNKITERQHICAAHIIGGHGDKAHDGSVAISLKAHGLRLSKEIFKRDFIVNIPNQSFRIQQSTEQQRVHAKLLTDQRSAISDY